MRLRARDLTMRTKASCRAFVARRLGTLARVVTVEFLLSRADLCPLRNGAQSSCFPFSASGACLTIVRRAPRGVFHICGPFDPFSLLELLRPAQARVCTANRDAPRRCGAYARECACVCVARRSSSSFSSAVLANTLELVQFNGISLVPHIGRSHVALAQRA